MKITKITGGLVAALVLTTLVCSESFAAPKKKPADVGSTLARIDAKTAATLSKLDARTINALSKMDPRAIDALSKMDAKALSAVSRMGSDGSLTTMRQNPKTVTAYNNMAKATAENKRR